MKLSSMVAGDLKSRTKGFNFALQIKFLDVNEQTLGDYMVIPTDMFDEMVRSLARDTDTER